MTRRERYLSEINFLELLIDSRYSFSTFEKVNNVADYGSKWLSESMISTDQSKNVAKFSFSSVFSFRSMDKSG